MFNDPQQGEQPTDMFDEQQQAESPLSNVMSQERYAPHDTGMSPKKGIIIIVGVVVALALLTGAGFAIYSAITKGEANKASSQEPQEQSEISAPESAVSPQTDPALQNPESQFAPDGAATPVQPSDLTAPLLDQQTAPASNNDSQLQGQTQVEGSSSGQQVQDPLEALKLIDSDSDGLNDYDETYLYHTSSVSADTDGDTYNDPDEIKNGYNPLGQGTMTDEQKLQWNIQ